MSLAASVFSIDWDDLQLNLPIPFAPPGTFYISNVGSATSRGVEFEVMARPHADVDLFASVGSTSARFGSGTVSSGVDVSDNKIQFTPDYTATFGAQYSRRSSPTGAPMAASTSRSAARSSTTTPTRRVRTPTR